MNKPNPVPLYDFDANFVNNLGNIVESIPWPESFTQTLIELLFLFFSTLTNIVPCVVNLIALPKRFESIGTALNDAVGSKDKSIVEFSSGHVGLIIGQRAHNEVWPKVGEWLKYRS